MVFGSGIPTWIVVDNEGAIQPPEPGRGASNPRSWGEALEGLDRDQLIEEVLDGRPRPYSTNNKNRRPTSPASPSRRRRQRPSTARDEPPSPSFSTGEYELEILGSVTSATPVTENSPSPSSFETTDPHRRSISCRRSYGKSIAPLLTCLSSKSSSTLEEEKQHQQELTKEFASLEILSDLNNDPRMELKLPDRLRFGVLAVQDASLESVNGVYHCTGMVDKVGHYTKSGVFQFAKGKPKKVTFSIFRCMHADRSSRWYLSICSTRHAPGTRFDTDLYAAMATGMSDEVPPITGWRVVVGSRVEGRPPLTMWIPHESRVQPCRVCGERPVSHVLIPCGHACLCQVCAQSVVARKLHCPMGKCQVHRSVRLYTSVEGKKEKRQRRLPASPPSPPSPPPPPPPPLPSSWKMAKPTSDDDVEIPSIPLLLPATKNGSRRLVM